jgi:hypothetical protein
VEPVKAKETVVAFARATSVITKVEQIESVARIALPVFEIFSIGNILLRFLSIKVGSELA